MASLVSALAHRVVSGLQPTGSLVLRIRDQTKGPDDEPAESQRTNIPVHNKNQNRTVHVLQELQKYPDRLLWLHLSLVEIRPT